MRVCGLWTGNGRERLHMRGSGFKMSKSELNMSGYRLNMRATGLKKTGNSWE